MIPSLLSSLLISTFSSTISYRNCPTALALIICSYIKQFDPFDDHSALELFKMTLVAFSPLYITLCFTALTVDVVGKWLLLGRRKAGEYAWDQSSYCQRWQMYLTLQEIRRGERHKTGVLDMIQGSQFLVWYFRALGATIGNNVCLYPNGGDPMFTEPDLVTIGDFVGVDDASLIAHINTRGVFRLNPLVVGNGCILKSMSRLLSGATMEPHSILLEHTLVLAGEQVEAGSVWQGWPSRSQVSLKAYRQQVNYNLDQVSMQTIRTLRSATKKPRPTEEEEGIAMKQSPSHPSIGIAIKKLTPQRKGSKDNLKKLSLDDDTVLNHKTQSAFNMKDDMDGYDDRQPLLFSFSGTKDKKKSSYTDL